jgi:hypothetical protein
MESISHWGQFDAPTFSNASKRIDDLFPGKGIDGKIRRLANIAGWETIGEMVTVHDAILLRVQNFGKKSFDRVKSVALELGIHQLEKRDLTERECKELGYCLPVPEGVTRLSDVRVLRTIRENIPELIERGFTMAEIESVIAKGGLS